MNDALTIGPDGIFLVKHFESFYARAYKCPAGVWTIGWGHTGLTHQDGTVKPGRRVTRDEAEALLAHDMAKFEAGVKRFVRVPLAQHEFDALVSFHFNTGALARGEKGCTLLRRLNAGDRAGAAAQFARWNRAGGEVSPGLVRRRAAERAMFIRGNWRAFCR